MSIDRVAGALLIGVPIAFNVFFLALARVFDYPYVLRSPVGLVLSRFLAGGLRLKLVWYGFMLTAVLFAPLAVLLGQVLARDDLQIVPAMTTIGVLAAVVQFLGPRAALPRACARTSLRKPDSSPATRDATASCSTPSIATSESPSASASAISSPEREQCSSGRDAAVVRRSRGGSRGRVSPSAPAVLWLVRVRRTLRRKRLEARRNVGAHRLHRLVPVADRRRCRSVGQAMVTIPLAPVDAVRITILMDNVTDPLLFPSEHVERTTWLHQLPRPRVASAVTDDGLPDALIAEPGFSALVRVDDRRARTDDPLRRGRHVRRASSRTCAGSSLRRETSRRSCSATGTGTTSPGWRGSRRSRAGEPSRAHPSRVLASSPNRDPWPRARRAARHQPLSARGRGLRDRRGSAAVVPARRVGARDGRGRSHDAVRDRLPRTRSPRSAVAGSPTR